MIDENDMNQCYRFNSVHLDTIITQANMVSYCAQHCKEFNVTTLNRLYIHNKAPHSLHSGANYGASISGYFEMK